MPELFLELFSEEIPARMQARAAEDLVRLCTEALAPLAFADVRSFYGPRRIALAATVAASVAASSTTERGPRTSAPEQALAGFLRKHGASREQARQEGDYWVLEKTAAAIPAATLIAAALPPLLRRFPWPKSMRWGEGSQFVWVRPLRRIVCLLDGAVVQFALRDGGDDGHGLAAADLTEGHRFHAPGAFAVTSCADWSAKLRQRRVLVDAAERRRIIGDGVAALGAARQVALVDDPGLLDEVAGLVEWPVPLLGRIDDAYMDLPAEVRQVSMRVNQRYFAFRNTDGSAAPYFGFVANIAPGDGGAVSTAGNERVLRARFADARHFWDLDRKARLESRVPLLDNITFHAKLGSQGDRVRRLERLAEEIAPLVGAGAALARDAARLAKADLVTGMVGEFPELQGVMGRYYALHDGEDRLVADAIRDHYAPKGPSDAVPTADVSIAVALADKLDLLVGFFAIGERPTGGGDPYALRRAALGIIRIIRENRLRLNLEPRIDAALKAVRDDIEKVSKQNWRLAGRQGAFIVDGAGTATIAHPSGSGRIDTVVHDVVQFLFERLRIQLRAEGARHDVLAAVFAAAWDDDIIRLLARTDAVAALLRSDHGPNLLTAYRRAANILRIEERKDGPHDAAPDPGLLRLTQETDLAAALVDIDEAITLLLTQENFSGAMGAMARLRPPLDAFFDKVTVNAPEPDLRLNRLRLVHKVRATMDRIADFAKIEG
ncbi:MAG: glycine--tRNA ligase subunit beta [Acetobacteraceae bacterium]